MPQDLLGLFLNYSGPITYLIVFGALMACGLGLPLPEDITLFAAGLLAYYGNANVHSMVLVSMFGVLLGDSIVYFLGHKFGDRVRRRWPLKKILPDDRFADLKARFKKKGNKVIFAGRFMPGLRAPIFFTAGTLHLPFRVFFFYDGLAALISVPAIIYSIWYFGEHVDKAIKIIKQVQFGIVGVILFLVAVFFLRRYLRKKREARADSLA
jgi:membrane protein DedA with SNARE-associated domain